MGITHATAAPGSDSGDGKISHNAWDEAHDISTLEITDIPTAEDDTALVLAPDGTGGVEFRAEAGVSGLTWVLDVDDPLTANTNLTSGTGTWTIDGTLKCVSAGGAHDRTYHNAAGFSFFPMSIVECEVKIPASFTYIGIYVGWGTGNGGMSWRINTGNTVQMERDGVANLGTTAYTVPAAGTWVKLRMVMVGGRTVGYVDGVRKYEATGYSYGDAGQAITRAGVACWGGTAYFRNLKGWSADLAQPA